MCDTALCANNHIRSEDFCKSRTNMSIDPVRHTEKLLDALKPCSSDSN